MTPEPAPKECVFTGSCVRLRPGWGARHVGDCGSFEERFADAVGGGYTPAEKNIACLREGNLAEEAYELDVLPEGVTVRAADRRGFARAWATFLQLAEGPDVQACRIRDWPELSVRGFELNLASMRRLTSEKALRLIDWAAEMKLNTVLVTPGDRFPFQACPALRTPVTFVAKEVRALAERIAFHAMDAVPHLPLPADPAQDSAWRAMAGELRAAFPTARHIHLGGAAMGNPDAPSPLARLTEAVRCVRDMDCTPILESAPCAAHAEVLDLLSREVTLCAGALAPEACREHGFSTLAMPRCTPGENARTGTQADDWRATLAACARACCDAGAMGLILRLEGDRSPETCYDPIRAAALAAW